LLAVGGDLSPDRLLLAYRQGIFPWYGEDEPILWWSPDPRLILHPSDLKVSKSLRRTIRKKMFRVTMDNAFKEVINACAVVRVDDGKPTWIVDDMIAAYCRLHEKGYAHSVEAWAGDQLAGGLYGISLGGCFFGESMFTRVSNASKVAFVHLIKQLAGWSFELIDCQVTTDHLIRLGASEAPRDQFLERLKTSLRLPTRRGKWQLDPDFVGAHF